MLNTQLTLVTVVLVVASVSFSGKLCFPASSLRLVCFSDIIPVKILFLFRYYIILSLTVSLNLF